MKALWGALGVTIVLLASATAYGTWRIRSQQTAIHSLKADAGAGANLDARLAHELAVEATASSAATLSIRVQTLEGDVAQLTAAVDALPASSSQLPLGTATIAYPDISTAINGLQSAVDCLTTDLGQVAQGYSVFVDCPDGS